MQEKRFLFAGYFCLATLLFFAVYFNVERLYGDSAYYLFRIINDKRFIIEHHRPIAVIIEIFPYILSRLSASVSTIILSFSLNEWLYFATSFVIIAHVLKKPVAAFAMLFAFIAGSRWNYFNPVSELYLSTPLYFILYALLDKKFTTAIIITISLLMIILIFNHPLNSIFVPALFIIFLLDQKPGNKKPYLFLLMFLAFVIIGHYFVLDGYERDPLSEHSQGRSSWDYLLKFNFARFWSKTIPWYLGTLVLFGFSFFYLLKKKKYGLFAFSFLFAAAFFLLAMYSSSFLFPNTYEPFERYLYILPLFSSALFFLACDQRNVFVRYTAPVLLVTYHLVINFNYGKFVKERYNYFENAISYAQQFPEQKMAFHSENYYPKPKGHDWEMVNESMLLSARDGKEKVRQVFVRESMNKDIVANLPEQEYFYAPEYSKKMSETNQKYFPLKPGKIRFANTDADQSGLPETFFKNVSIELNVPEKFKKGKEILIPILLRNKNSVPLTSGMGSAKVTLSYHWYKDGNPLPWEDVQTPIIADVYSEVKQEMVIRTPQEKGNYELRADVLFRNSQWAGVDSKKYSLIID